MHLTPNKAALASTTKVRASAAAACAAFAAASAAVAAASAAVAAASAAKRRCSSEGLDTNEVELDVSGSAGPCGMRALRFGSTVCETGLRKTAVRIDCNWNLDDSDVCVCCNTGSKLSLSCRYPNEKFPRGMRLPGTSRRFRKHMNGIPSTNRSGKNERCPRWP